MLLPIYTITYASFDGVQLHTETKVKTSLEEALRCQNDNVFSISQDLHYYQDISKCDDFYDNNQDAMHVAFENGNVFFRTDVIVTEYEFYLQERK